MKNAKKNNDLFFLALLLCPECIIPLVGWIFTVVVLLTPLGGKLVFESFFSSLPPSKASLIAKLLSIGIPTASWGAILKILAVRELHEKRKNFMKAVGMTFVIVGAFLIMISLILVISHSLQQAITSTYPLDLTK